MNNFSLLFPEFLVLGLAFLILTLDLLIKHKHQNKLAYLSILGLLAITAFSIQFLSGKKDNLYSNLILVDGYSLFFKTFFMLLGAVTIIMSIDYVKRHLQHPGEYYAIVLFSVLAMMLMASSGELLTAYISLELLSFGLYVLVSYNRYNPESNEAGVKYILLGAFSSAILLYGISQIYGLTGTTHINEISLILSTTPLNLGLIIGIVFLIGGLGFKVAAVPFHMWAPDVYQGAPTPVTSYLSTGSKAAAFALVIRIFVEALLPAANDWQILLVIMAVLSMTLGNVVALVQSNIKRLLGYSSIGQVGYLLMGIAALAYIDSDRTISTKMSHLVTNGLLFHLVSYAISTMLAFMAITAVSNATNTDNISDFAGMSKRAPITSMMLAATLFSLAGLPVFAGFTSKFYLFTAVAAQDLLWLSGLAIATSVISLYYYLMIVRQMYIEPPKDPSKIPTPKLALATMIVLFSGMILLGIYPAPLMDIIQGASESLLDSATVK